MTRGDAFAQERRARERAARKREEAGGYFLEARVLINEWIQDKELEEDHFLKKLRQGRRAYLMAMKYEGSAREYATRQHKAITTGVES